MTAKYDWHEECDGPICQDCDSCMCEGGCRCGGAPKYTPRAVGYPEFQGRERVTMSNLPEGYEPIPWDELKPYEQQQWGYWLDFGDRKVWVRVCPPEAHEDCECSDRFDHSLYDCECDCRNHRAGCPARLSEGECDCQPAPTA